MPGILLCGSEGEQFQFNNELTFFGQDDKRRGSVLVDLGDQFFRKFDSSYPDFWVHYRCALGTDTPTYHTGRDSVQIRAGINNLVNIRSSSGPNNDSDEFFFRIDVAKDGSATEFHEGVEWFPHAAEQWVNYDIRVQVGGTSNEIITVDFYRNEVLRFSETFTSNGVPYSLPDSVLLQSRSVENSTAETWYQDVIVTDALPTVGMELATVVPSAVGVYADFVNDYTAVDDLGYDQSKTISTKAPGEKESWFLTDPEFDIGDKVIYGLSLTTVAQLDLAGIISDFKPFLRINAVDYPAAPLVANNIAPKAYTVTFTENPSTNAPWVIEDLSGIESGVESI